MPVADYFFLLGYFSQGIPDAYFKTFVGHMAQLFAMPPNQVQNFQNYLEDIQVSIILGRNRRITGDRFAGHLIMT